MGHGTFATVINCMDGRVQEPVIGFMKNKYGVEYIDMVTEAGPIKFLDENKDTATIESIKARVGISANVHGSKSVAIVGHYDCGGNPVDKETQLKQIASSKKLVESWGMNMEIIGLWVDENWTATEV